MTDQVIERPANVLVDCAMRCVINDVERPLDGGRVLLSALLTREAIDFGVQQVELMLLFTRDEPMRAFPSRRCDMETVRWRLLVVAGDEPLGEACLYDLPAWCPENDVEAPYDGGRVKLQVRVQELPKAMRLADAFVTINCTDDEPMRVYPHARVDRETRRYRIGLIRLAA